MANITNIPAARVPFIDDKTGLISREWYRFFFNLFTLTGGGGTTTMDASITGVAGVIDTHNSSTTPLAGGATFTGAWTNALNYGQIQITVFSNVSSSATGLEIQFSMDGVNIDHTHDYPIVGGTGETVQMQPHEQYFRVVYTNGAAAQSSFRLQTLLRPIAGNGSILEAGKAISAHDDCLLTKSILTGQSVIDGTYINARMTPDGGLLVNQDIQIDPANSSTANLAVGATFTGGTTSNITASMIQLFLKTDQNCTVWLDQSQDGINFDISDKYDYFAAIGNFGINVGAFGAYFRVRVTNIGVATTTYFRLQTIYVPIANQLPRSLSPEGYLQTAVNHIEDTSGFKQYYTPFGEQVSVPLFRLIGSVFNGSTLDTNFWTPVVGTGGTVAPTNGFLALSTGTTANNAVSISSVRRGRYIAGEPTKVRTLIKLGDAGTANNLRRWGAFDANNGAYFELNGTTLSVGVRKATVDSKIANGSFNGLLGNSILVDTNSHFYEIVYTPAIVWFYFDNKLIHTQQFSASSWTATLDLPLQIENINSGGQTANVSISSSILTMLRMGLPQTQTIGFFQSGTTAGVTLKSGSGNIQGIVISSVTNNAVVTLYDNTAASGTVIWASGAMGAQTIPLSLDFKGIQFSNGLTLTITGAACNALITYE